MAHNITTLPTFSIVKWIMANNTLETLTNPLFLVSCAIVVAIVIAAVLASVMKTQPAEVSVDSE